MPEHHEVSVCVMKTDVNPSIRDGCEFYQNIDINAKVQHFLYAILLNCVTYLNSKCASQTP